MIQSIVACAIDAEESSIVRMKSSTGEGRILSGYRSFPFGRTAIASTQGKRLLKKLTSFAAQWRGENMAIALTHETLHPLPAYFSHGASPETRHEYSRIEAAYFLENPDSHQCDSIAYGDSDKKEPYEKPSFSFTPTPACNWLKRQFIENHPIIFKGSHIPPLLYTHGCSGEPQAILEITGDYVMFLIANGRRLSHFSFRPINSREEAEYFAIKELQEATFQRNGDTGRRQRHKARLEQTGQERNRA